MRYRFIRKIESGFSLIELLISITILLIVTSLVISAFASAIRSSSRERGLAERDATVKRAMELMAIEIGQAGVLPDILNLKSTGGSRINADIAMGTTNVTIEGTFRGFYPGRPIILGLPEGEPALSEVVKISSVDPTVKSLSFYTPTKLAHQLIPLTASIANGNITSSSFPNPFGILNPPPLTKPSKGPKRLPLTTLTKTVDRIGFVGDIFGNGELQYVEYSFENARLLRSITPINETSKRPSNLLLENIKEGNFTLVYSEPNIPIPSAVRISITSRSSIPEPRITGGAIDPDKVFKSITTTGEVMPRGTSAAAFIWAKGGERQLRNMLPPCLNSSPGTGYPPCEWSEVPWWQNVLSFSSELP
jgi:prepilin-type N-terminal cleavage/methylation domain-containing protein